MFHDNVSSEYSDDQDSEPPNVNSQHVARGQNTGRGRAGRGRGRSRRNGEGAGGANTSKATERYVPLSIVDWELQRAEMDDEDGADSRITYKSEVSGYNSNESSGNDENDEHDENDDDNDDNDDSDNDDQRAAAKSNEEGNSEEESNGREDDSDSEDQKRANSHTFNRRITHDMMSAILGVDLNGAAKTTAEENDSVDDWDFSRKKKRRRERHHTKKKHKRGRSKEYVAQKELFRVKGISCVACALGPKFQPVMDWIDRNVTKMSSNDLFRMATYKYKELIIHPSIRENQPIPSAALNFKWKALRAHVLSHSCDSRVPDANAMRMIQIMRHTIERNGLQKEVSVADEEGDMCTSLVVDKGYADLYMRLLDREQKLRSRLKDSDPTALVMVTESKKK